MATPANNAAVPTNSLFLMECFLFFSLRLPRAGPIAYRLRGKRICLPCSSDRPQEMLRCRAARFPVIRGEPNMQDDLGNWSLAAERTAGNLICKMISEIGRSLPSELRIEADDIAPH